MHKSSRFSPMVTIGLDLGDKYSFFFVLDIEGEFLEEGRIRTTPAGMDRFFRNREASRVALEVGTHSPWISRLVADLGHEVLVANARKLRAIYESNVKSDRADAEMLARIARIDPQLLAPIQHRSKQAQADLAMVRSRDALVRARTLLVNHVRGSVKTFGGRLAKYSTHSFHRKAPEAIPPDLAPALTPVIQTIETLTHRIDQQKRAIVKTSAVSYPVLEVLQQVPGVGPLTALTFLLTIQDPSRFRKSRNVAAYLGLTPRRSQSGNQDPQLRITKAGDENLRRLLVQSAQYLLGPFGPDTALRHWGLALAERGGARGKKRAVVAVARKLAILLHRLWVTGEVYEPTGSLETHTNRTTKIA